MTTVPRIVPRTFPNEFIPYHVHHKLHMIAIREAERKIDAYEAHKVKRKVELDLRRAAQVTRRKESISGYIASVISDLFC